MPYPIQVIDNSNRPKLSDAVGQLADTIRGKQQRAEQISGHQAQTRADTMLRVINDPNFNQQTYNAMHAFAMVNDPAAGKYLPDLSNLQPDQFQVEMAKVKQGIERQKGELEGKQLGHRIKRADQLDTPGQLPTDTTEVFNPGAIGTGPYVDQQREAVLQNPAAVNASPANTLSARIGAKIDPTGSDTLKSKTDLEQEQMRQSGATKREGMQQSGETGRTRMRIDADRATASSALGASGGAGSGLSGEEFLKTLDPASAGVVRKIANYELDPTKAASIRNSKNQASERLKLIQAAIQFDPTYDATQYPTRQAIRKDFTSGQSAQNVRSLNTVIAHLDKLSSAAEALDNTGPPAVNAVGNFVSKQLGSAAVTNFTSAADAVATELAKVFKGTGASSEREVQEWRQNISPNMSPEQHRGTISTLVDLLAGRVGAMDSQWKAGIGKPRDFRLLDDKSIRILKDKLGIDPSMVDSMSGGGTGTSTGIGTGTGAGARMSKEQVNSKTGARRTVYSDDGGRTWHP